MKISITHHFRDGSTRSSLKGVKVPKTEATAQAYAAIAKGGGKK